MLLDVGIVFGIYIGVRLVEKYGKNMVKKESMTIKPSKNTKILSVEKHQNFLKETVINRTEKECNHYLKISTASIGLAAIGNVSPFLHLLSISTIAYTSQLIFKRVESSLIKKEGKIGHNMLVSFSIFLALTTSQFFALSITIFLYHMGRKTLAKTQDHSKKVLTHLFEQQHQKVRVSKDQTEIEVPIETLQLNEIVVVNTGEIIPIDGIICEGVAMIDQHALTGESQPAEKEVGDRVFASTSVICGRICVKVENMGLNTTISKIGNILTHTVDFKTNLQSKAEKWSDKIATPILGISAFALPIVGPVSTTAILNTGFGDRLRIAAPLGMLNHLNLASHKGILIKDGRALECLNQVDTILFDKTGTLTEEQPQVGRVILCCHSYKEKELLTYAAAAEGKLSHPIAKALVNKAKELNLILPDIKDSQYQIGLGITVFFKDKIIKVGSHRFMTMANIAIPEIIEKTMEDSLSQGYSLIMVAIDGDIKGAIEIQPSIRPEVKQIIRGLRQRGIKHIAIVSGDHKQPTQKLANDLEMDSYFYDILPENKAQIVEQLQKEGKVVCFVGDGINDAIAIKKANVSISLKGATSIATDLAQVVLMDASLSRLCDLFDLAKSLNKNLLNTLTILIVPVTFNVLGGFLLHFNMMNTIIINNIAFLSSLANTRVIHRR